MSLFIGIQSRINSSRFPQKSFIPVLGIPLVIRVIQRVQQIKYPHTLALLVPQNDQQIFEEFLAQHNIDIPVFGGSEHNVLKRYIDAAKHFNATDLIMRVTGDNPLLSINLAEQLISIHGSHDLSHFVGNPLGTGVEIISRHALETSYHSSRDPFEQEHVTQYIYKNPQLFSIYEPLYTSDIVEHFSIDTPHDLQRIEDILSKNPLWDLPNT